jgi:hypothetical protein
MHRGVSKMGTVSTNDQEEKKTKVKGEGAKAR